jgi:hypothetical protein
MCEHMFVSARIAREPRLGISRPRFLAALDAGDLAFIRSNAAALPPIRLSEALRICLMFRDQDPERYERAALRWLGRFALEAPVATFDDLQLALDALDALPQEADAAMEQLSALCVRHNLPGA